MKQTLITTCAVFIIITLLGMIVFLDTSPTPRERAAVARMTERAVIEKMYPGRYIVAEGGWSAHVRFQTYIEIQIGDTVRADWRDNGIHPRYPLVRAEIIR